MTNPCEYCDNEYAITIYDEDTRKKHGLCTECVDEEIKVLAERPAPEPDWDALGKEREMVGL